MTARQLPKRPNLEQLKRQAKDLLHAARANDAAALARFRILPTYTNATPDTLAHAPLALHDAQSVIARELGFDSWNALRAHVEEHTLTLDDAIAQLVEAATDGRPDRAARLLALHPAMPAADFYAALVVCDETAVDTWLAKRPALATTAGGPRGWEPLHYVCHTAMARGDDARAAHAAAIARRLIALGADPNARFRWLHHGVRRPVLWGAVCVTHSLPLASALLDAGADPDDGVTLTIAASGGDIAALDLLRAHGADLDHAWATNGAAPLYEILHWATTPTGVHWLLDHGADPDPVFAENGETPLHVAAARWDVVVADALVRRGADVTRRRADGRTPYAIAALSGNRAVADRLLTHGAPADLSDVDRLVAACSRGDRPDAAAILGAQPDLRTALGDEHYAAFYTAAERGDTTALTLMLDCGFDPNHPDESIGKTVLHIAAMEGWPDTVRFLLAHGASVSVRDREFHGTPLVWAAEGSRTARTGRDHAAVGRLLLDAGSPTDWDAGAEPAEGLLEILRAWTRGR